MAQVGKRSRDNSSESAGFQDLNMSAKGLKITDTSAAGQPHHRIISISFFEFELVDRLKRRQV